MALKQPLTVSSSWDKLIKNKNEYVLFIYVTKKLKPGKQIKTKYTFRMT